MHLGKGLGSCQHGPVQDSESIWGSRIYGLSGGSTTPDKVYRASGQDARVKNIMIIQVLPGVKGPNCPPSPSTHRALIHGEVRKQ